jgi:hypothetical protein
MSGRILKTAIELAIAAQFAAAVAQGGDYRGAASGWPAYTNGTYAAGYPANYGVGPTYYVARPVTTAGYADAYGTRSVPTTGYAMQPTAVQYAPVRAAYANPTYYAAYGRSPVVYRPVGYAAGYSPTAGYAPNATGGVPYSTGYAPTTAYYAPVTANYAPANSYAVTPAGSMSAGSEAVVRYQAAPVNYVAPQYTYRTNYAPVPVYMYRPVTAYDPIVGQPVTCMQASTCNTCQPQRSRCFSLLNPFTWFGSGSSCGRSSCGAPPSCGSTNSCQTNYCGQQPSCGQPYYPVQPMTPVVPVYPAQPAPTTVIPAMPRGFIPGGTTTIPPPPTVQPGTRTIISPADAPPSLAPRPGTFVAPPTGGTFTPLPGTTIPAQPATPGFGTPLPGGSFQPAPQGGSFGTGTNYPPGSDPYSTLTPVERPNQNSVQSNSPIQAPIAPQKNDGSSNDMGVIRPPASSRMLAPGVQTVPDLDSPISRESNAAGTRTDAASTPKPVNSAPKLIDPRDKTAGVKNRWAAVPAKWPEKNASSNQLSQRPVTHMRAYEASAASATAKSPYVSTPNVSTRPNAADYDDGGWKSAAGF